uniref:Pentatricopeptide repeat-containing protein n=2 Tax=Cucumis sativus TaxID=3659 RepID=A0A0A0KZV4_CUCSA
MILNFTSPCLTLTRLPPPKLLEPLASSTNGATVFMPLLLCSHAFFAFTSFSKSLRVRTSLSGSDIDGSAAFENPASELLDDELIVVVSGAKDADEALGMIGDKSGRSGGTVSVSDCRLIISAALKRNNPELALSVFYAMRSTFYQAWEGVNENASIVERWKWSRPDVHVYTLLIEGLAASLRVSDALRMIEIICRVGVTPAEEVPFGKVVKCPSCMVAVAVAQPQHGIQIVSCAKCCYKYELISGNIVNIESEEIRMDTPAWEKALRFLNIMKRKIPVAVHSIVVQTPSGVARTQKFATETADLPAREGERVTIAAAAPSNVFREVGPIKFSPKDPNLYSGEAMCLTNHSDGRESLLLRVPGKENSSLLNPSILFPLIVLSAAGDAASGVIDPSLPQLLIVAGFASLAAGATLNSLILPQFNRLPQRSVDIIAIKQQLLSQYNVLQSRIGDLKLAAEKEVWMLARMCQLENKIFAVGEPSYRARRSRIKKVREGLENSLKQRIELIESYARISSMIEIEVEMESDVIAAEAASSVERVSEQIEQIMVLENLEERWKLQAEANDEAERLLNQSMPTEKVTVRPPILHASISRFPHHLVPALPTQNYYLSNKSWSINNKTKYFTNILTSQ